MTIPHPRTSLVRAGLAVASLMLASWAQAAEFGFCDGLPPEERAAAGITKLTPDQGAALDALVAHDVTLARQGGVTGFSSAFLARRTPGELAAIGISRLSDRERSALDLQVATAIALGPPPDQQYTFSPPAKPAPPPAPSKTMVSAPLHAELHGDLSFTVGGASHGGSFYGTAMDLNVTDPTGKFTIGVGFEDFRGKGLIGLYGPYSPYYGPVGPPYLSPYWGP